MGLPESLDLAICAKAVFEIYSEMCLRKTA